MVRKLLIVAASSLVIAIVCLGGAWAVGGREMSASNGWTFDADEEDSGPHESRTLTFDPSRPLVIDAPVDLRFTRGKTVSMTVSARPGLLAALRWEDGRLFLAGKRGFDDGTIDVEITAPRLPGIVMSSAGNLELNDLRQPSFEIEMAGAGNIDANGKVDRLKVDAAGAGNVDLSGLDATDAEVDLAGFGNADISASGKVEASIAGAGNITLHRKPRELHSDIAGLGNVSHDY